MLSAPSANNILHIISFLFKAAMPNFDFTGRYEEEVPIVAKQLGYPFAISAQDLKAVGAPQTWPKILGVLSWLVDLLKYSETEREGAMGDEDGFEEEGGERMFFE